MLRVEISEVDCGRKSGSGLTMEADDGCQVLECDLGCLRMIEELKTPVVAGAWRGKITQPFMVLKQGPRPWFSGSTALDFNVQ